MEGHGHAKSWFGRMLQNVMASGYAMNEESNALKDPNYSIWSNGW